MRRLAVAWLAVSLTACSGGQILTTGSTSLSESDFGGRVTWITDGDSILVDTVSRGEIEVRLLGINAPERGECFYDEATQFLIGFLEGESIELTDGGTDQFGRILSHVWKDGEHVNSTIARSGFAIATTPDEGDELGIRTLEAEADAIHDGKGLWAHDACGPAPDSKPVIVPEASRPDPDGSPESEAIVIRNDESNTLDLTGWTLRDESSRHRYRFPAGTILEPGASLRIVSTDAAWEPGGSPVWNNDGDMALLLDPGGNVVDHWRY